MACLSTLQQDAVRIFRKALKAVESDTLLQHSVQFNDSKFSVNLPIIDSEQEAKNKFSIDLAHTTVHIIGGGKSVLPMACSLLEQLKLSSGLSPNYVNGCLSLPFGSNKSAGFRRLNNHTANGPVKNLFEYFNVECHYGALNNLPDKNSQYATERIMKLIDETCNKSLKENHSRKPLFIVLLSGGGSACITMPKCIGLEEKLKIIKALVSNGVDIKQLNSVRRCLSEVKGGNLAYNILKKNKDAQIVTLIISDVIGDPIEFIASGPTYINPDLAEQPKSIPQSTSMPGRNALKLLIDLNIEICPELIEMLKSCDEEIDPEFNTRVHNFIIGNNRLALEAAITDAKYLGYDIEYLGNEMQGDVDLILLKLLTRLENAMKQSDQNFNKLCIIGGGEATVNLKTSTVGQGGRAQEMALKYLSKKFEQDPKENLMCDDAFLAAGTDGQDGPTKFAGCLSSWSMWSDLDHTRVKSEILSHLETHDSTNFWLKNKKEWLIETGLTGTNVMDIYMILIDKRTEHNVTSRSHL